MHVRVRHVTEADLQVAGTIAMAAYERPQSLEAAVRRSLALQPDGWFLALLDDAPVSARSRPARVYPGNWGQGVVHVVPAADA